MHAVNTLEGIAYGFKHILYGILVVLIGLLFASAGFPLLDSGEYIGAVVFFLIGLAITIAGSFGLGYKVIADAVATGVAHAESSNQVRITATKIPSEDEG